MRGGDSRRRGSADWARLLRLPNLCTVPGDVIAGALIAGGGTADWSRVAFLVPASLCLYATGLILNDLVDAGRDASERPDRPIPSGAVTRVRALAVAVLLAAVGIGLAFAAGPTHGLVAGLLLFAVLLYDGPARRVPAVGFLVMGACRGLNVGLGAGEGWLSVGVVVVMAAETAYVTALTAAAHRETEGAPRGMRLWAPLALLLAGLVGATALRGLSTAGAAAAGLAAVAVLAAIARAGRSGGGPVLIGRLVRCLVPIQGAWAMIAGGSLLGGVFIYPLWPLAAAASRRYRGS